MSGPKKADVEAQLNVARTSQRKCAGLISKATDSAIATLLQSASNLFQQAEQAGNQAQQAANGLNAEMARVAPEGVRNAQSDASTTQKAISSARTTLDQARTAVARAQQEERAADAVFARAETTLQQATSAMNRASAHYLHDEMRQAKEARALFDQASAELAKAASTRNEAERRTHQAAQQVNEALATGRNAAARIQATRNEAEARLRAEEEARKIAEEQRRLATLATGQARAAVTRLETTPHNKFRPGQAAQIKKDLETALARMTNGDMPDATTAANQVTAKAQRLEQEVAAALQEYERQRAQAEAEISSLNATLQGIDPDLIRQWSNTPDALNGAKTTLSTVNQLLKAERFTEASTQAQNASNALKQALTTAAENQSLHERREAVGEAIMDVLEELGFQVGEKPGSRTDALQIVGKTPDLTGKGDFAISIPLDGEIDFTVTEQEGGTSCVAAVNALRDRLAERGVKWNTTDWGHAKGATFATGTRETSRERTQTREKG